MLVKPKRNIRRQYLLLNLEHFNFAYNKCLADTNESFLFKFQQISAYYQQENLNLAPGMFLIAQTGGSTSQVPIKLAICMNQDNSKNYQNLSNTSANMTAHASEVNLIDDVHMNDLLNEFNRKTNFSSQSTGMVFIKD